MSEVIDKHYRGFAGESRSSWIHRESYRVFWARFLAESMDIKTTHRILDLGGGSGDLSKALVKLLHPRDPILCVDPSPDLIRRIRNRSITTAVADAIGYLAGCSDSAFDRIILKQIIHHIPSSQRPLLYRELHRVLRPGGQVAILTMPETIHYPMFKAAVKKFEKGQIRHESILLGLRKIGFSTKSTIGCYPLRITWERYCMAVRERFISDLRSFSSDEIEVGLEEVYKTHKSPLYLHFNDEIYCFLAKRL